MVPEPRFGKVRWSSSSKSGSQGGGLVENDDEHYEIIGQMNNTKIIGQKSTLRSNLPLFHTSCCATNLTLLLYELLSLQIFN